MRGGRGGDLPRRGHGGDVVAINRAERPVHQPALGGHRAAQGEDGLNLARSDDRIVFVVVRPAENTRIVDAALGLHLLLQRGRDLLLDDGIPDIRVCYQGGDIVLQHRQIGYVRLGVRPFAETRKSPRLQPLGSQVDDGVGPVTAVFADGVPRVEGDGVDVRAFPVVNAPGRVVRRGLRRKRGELPLAAGDGGEIQLRVRRGVHTDIEAGIAVRRDQPPHAVVLDHVIEAGGCILPAGVEHSAPRVVAARRSPGGQRGLLFGSGRLEVGIGLNLSRISGINTLPVSVHVRRIILLGRRGGQAEYNGKGERVAGVEHERRGLSQGARSQQGKRNGWLRGR